jgi:predicted metalloprotease with PDZ domain
MSTSIGLAQGHQMFFRTQRLPLQQRIQLVVVAMSTGLNAAVAIAQPAVDRAERSVRRQLAVPTTPQPRPAARVAEPGYLGVITDRRDDGTGVRLREVVPDGPAAKAGLQSGDLITSIDDQPIASNADMARILENSPVGAELAFTVNRQGAEEQVKVELTQRPAPAAGQLPFGRVPDEAAPAETRPALAPDTAVPSPTPAGPVLGVRAVPVSGDAQKQFNLPSTNGAVVMGVTVGSAAERAGIPVGSVITAIDGQAVTDPEELGRLIREAGTGKEIEVTFSHRGQEFRRRTVLGGGNATAGTTQNLSPVRPVSPSVGSRLSPGAFAATGAAAPPDRIEQLERRIKELEDRIARLEAALQGAEQSGSE